MIYECKLQPLYYWNIASDEWKLIWFGLGLWCLTPLLTIFQLDRGGGNRRNPVASHWETLSYNVVSNTPRMSGIRTHNVSGDRHCSDFGIMSIHIFSFSVLYRIHGEYELNNMKWNSKNRRHITGEGYLS